MVCLWQCVHALLISGTPPYKHNHLSIRIFIRFLTNWMKNSSCLLYKANSVQSAEPGTPEWIFVDWGEKNLSVMYFPLITILKYYELKSLLVTFNLFICLEFFSSISFLFCFVEFHLMVKLKWKYNLVVEGLVTMEKKETNILL